MNKNSMQGQTLSRVMKELKPFRIWIVISLICAAVTVACTLLIPVYIGEAVDCMLGVGALDVAALTKIITHMAIAIGGTFMGQLIMNRVNNHITYSITMSLRRKAFAKLMQVPIKEIDQKSSGDYMSRIVTDADGFSDGLLMGFSQLFTGVLTIIGTIIFMLRVNLSISLVVIALTPVSLLVARFIANKTYAMFQLQAKHRAAQTGYINEMIAQHDIARAFNYISQSEDEFSALNSDLAESSLRATFYSSITNPATRFVNSLIYCGVGIAGAMLAISGGITVGALTSFLAYASQYAKPFNEISGVITEMQNALACANRLFEMMDAEPVAECDDLALGEVKGEVEFKNVSFSYTDEKPLIEGLNLKVKPGQRVAIVGPTGSGKTTLINLLMRFYETKGGEITVDGIDITRITRANLRAQFGMVLQETWLMEGTVRQNLLMANPSASEEEMIRAAKTTSAHEFIKRLPQGYDTRLGSDDGSLSQGERQLLCITRVMLALPPMLILDEATSSIDTRTEQKIQAAFHEMMKGRTSFVVAHRLSTIREADIILYMENGCVKEQGNHAELLSKDGAYARLYRRQYQLGSG